MPVTATIVLLSNMFKDYGTPNSETQVSKFSMSFPVVNTTRKVVHVQFMSRKLVFTIISMAREGNLTAWLPVHYPNQHVLP